MDIVQNVMPARRTRSDLHQNGIAGGRAGRVSSTNNFTDSKFTKTLPKSSIWLPLRLLLSAFLTLQVPFVESLIFFHGNI